MMNFEAILAEAEDGGCWAEVPALPGCVMLGEFMEELDSNHHEANDVWFPATEPEHGAVGRSRILEMATAYRKKPDHSEI